MLSELHRFIYHTRKQKDIQISCCGAQFFHKNKDHDLQLICLLFIESPFLGIIEVYEHPILINMLHALPEDFVTWPCLAALVVLFVVYRTNRLSSFRKRMEAVRSRPQLNVAPHKVIVALDLVDLFVQISQSKRQNFQKLKLKATGIAHTILKVKEFFGIGLYFKPKMLKKNMRLLLQSLADNPKIQLFLYTTLPLPAADDLLANLCLTHFFPAEFRRSCREDYCQRLKHPTEVYQNTKRVIILTNLCQDYALQEPKYFVQVKDSAEVSRAIKMLSQVIKKNKSVEELHNELADAKAELEYDI